jgi:hypothetical protein
MLLEHELDCLVDATRESRRLAVPREGPGVPLGNDRGRLLVVQHELELGQLFVQVAPPPVQDVTVQVVLGPDISRGDASSP